MKIRMITLCIITLVFAGCEKATSLIGGVQCDSEVSKRIVAETFSNNISDVANARVKELIETENITVDMGKLRSALKQITFNVTNVRTNNSDPNSNKKYCVTDFIVNIPAQMVKDADASRAVYEENSIAQSAILTDLSFENNQLKRDLEYFVQPTDDGEKVFVTLENPDALAFFVRDIAIDSLLKSARQSAAEISKQQEMKRISEENAAVEEYQKLLVEEAQANLDQANENLNLVWNATTKEIREQLLAEQRVWLKKRDLECKLESSSADNPEVFRLNCETNMTNERISDLRRKIYYLEP